MKHPQSVATTVADTDYDTSVQASDLNYESYGSALAEMYKLAEEEGEDVVDSDEEFSVDKSYSFMSVTPNLIVFFCEKPVSGSQQSKKKI